MDKKFQMYRGLPKSVYVIFIIQIVNRFGDFVLPFMTLLLTKKLGLPLGTVGLIAMIGSVLSIPGSFIAGKAADHIGRKKTYIISQTTAALALIPCAFITRPYVIVVFLLLSNLFNGGVRPCISAVIADVLPPERRQAGYSLQYLGINIGVAVGPMVAGFLFNNFLPMLFLGDAITSFIAVTLFVKYIEESNNTKLEEKHAAEEKQEKGNVFTILLRRPKILVFLIIYAVFCFVYTQTGFSLPLMLDKVFAGKGAERFGFLMSVNAITVVVLTMFVTTLTQRFKALPSIIMGGILYTVGLGMISIIRSFPLFIVSTVLWTIGEILTATSFGVYLANNSPSNYRARFSAIGSMSWAIGAALGTSLMGKYIAGFGIEAVWPLTFILGGGAVIAMLVLYLGFDREKN